jgi:Tfp pilus assembly protein PilV
MTRFRKGTSIVEVVIAAALISVAIIAALSLTNQSQKQNTYARGLAEATKYASQASDWIRSERDNLGYTTLYTVDDGTYCINSFPADFTQMEADVCDDNSFITNTIYQREVVVTKNADSINLIINVTWNETIPRQAKIEMEITSWH